VGCLTGLGEWVSGWVGGRLLGRRACVVARAHTDARAYKYLLLWSCSCGRRISTRTQCRCHCAQWAVPHTTARASPLSPSSTHPYHPCHPSPLTPVTPVALNAVRHPQ